MRKQWLRTVLVLYALTYLIGVPQISLAFKENPCAQGSGFDFYLRGGEALISALSSGEVLEVYGHRSFAIGPLLAFNAAGWGACDYKQVTFWFFGLALPIYGEYGLSD